MKKGEQIHFKEDFSEREAWNGLRQGNLDALGTLYDLLVDPLFLMGVKIIKDREVVQDQIHDLFLGLYKNHDNLAEVHNVKGYLMTSFKRKLYKLNNFRITYLSPNWENSLKEISNNLKIVPSHEENIIASEKKKERLNFLNERLSRLTNHQQNILQMRFFEEKSFEEIALFLNLSVASTRTLLYRTIKTLRKSSFSLFF